MRLVNVAIALALTLIVGRTSAIAQTDFSGPSQSASYARLRHAWDDLADGRPQRARVRFANELAYWRPFAGTGSPGYVDATRGLMLAYLYEGRDADALHALRTIEGEYGAEPNGDRLVFAGNISEAIRVYRDATQDQAVVDPQPGPDRIVSAGASYALRGDWRGAIRAWSRPAAGGGPYELTDLQTALCGLAYAQLSDWRSAERAWLGAAQTDRNVPQTSWLYTGSIMALSMLYHFRAHFARGEGEYRWP